jgi:hypothetical protein
MRETNGCGDIEIFMVKGLLSQLCLSRYFYSLSIYDQEPVNITNPSLLSSNRGPGVQA